MLKNLLDLEEAVFGAMKAQLKRWGQAAVMRRSFA